MKFIIRPFVFTIIVFTSFLYGQGFNFGGHFNPDSLETLTVSGIVKIDSSMSFHPIYFLDINNDKQPDYMLNFGPYWYEPDSSAALRPNNGYSITVKGGSFSNEMIDYDMLIVYEINGEFWRDPYEPIWNNLDGFMSMGGHRHGECNNYSFGWDHDSLTTVTISGTVFVDSTFIYAHYYLDENNDSIPDYMLNFGPPWYMPDSSNAVRPMNGEQINITGDKIKMPHFDMVVVYEINGMTWRDSSDLGFHFGGGWMHSNSTQPQKFHSPFDDSDWMIVHPGWHGGGMGGGMMMPDSIFTQIFELLPNNLPNAQNENAFAGYQFNLMYPSRQDGMGPGFGCGGMMQFNNNMDFQLHYNNIQLNGNDINENSIKAKYYDSNSDAWVEVSDAVLNTSTNTVTFSKSSVSNLVILTAEKTATGISNNQLNTVKGFQLFQNYPNPFNPSTNIKFEVKENAHVILSVYNIIGQKVAEPVNSDLSAGIHNVLFNGINLSSGIYFYELKAGDFFSIKKMQLLK